MSVKKQPVLWALTACFGFGALAFFVFRASASVSDYFDAHRERTGWATGLNRQSISLKMTTSSAKFIGSSKTTTVRATVRMPFDFDQTLEYQWTLGSEVVLQKGMRLGSIPQGLQKDQDYEIEIGVTGFTPEHLRHIGFEIRGQKNGRRVYAESLISSQKEKSFEYTVQQVERLKAAQVGRKK